MHDKCIREDLPKRSNLCRHHFGNSSNGRYGGTGSTGIAVQHSRRITCSCTATAVVQQPVQPAPAQSVQPTQATTTVTVEQPQTVQPAQAQMFSQPSQSVPF